MRFPAASKSVQLDLPLSWISRN